MNLRELILRIQIKYNKTFVSNELKIYLIRDNHNSDWAKPSMIPSPVL